MSAGRARASESSSTSAGPPPQTAAARRGEGWPRLASPRRSRDADPVGRVLDRRAARRIELQPARRLEVDVGRRLAPRHLLRGDRDAEGGARPVSSRTRSMSGRFEDEARPTGQRSAVARTASRRPEERQPLAVSLLEPATTALGDLLGLHRHLQRIVHVAGPLGELMPIICSAAPACHRPPFSRVSPRGPRPRPARSRSGRRRGRR